MCTLVEELSNWYDYFLRLSGFPDLFSKVYLITFKFSQFDFSATLLQEQSKSNSLISFFIMQRDYNGYNYDTYNLAFSTISNLRGESRI